MKIVRFIIFIILLSLDPISLLSQQDSVKKKYKSGTSHSTENASAYTKTHELPHRFLAYRDFQQNIQKYSNLHSALDLGSGTGASSKFLKERGFDVVGVDKSSAMVEEARKQFPTIDFVELSEIKKLDSFDFVFSSFVLFELSSKEEILEYLNTAASLLRKGGIFYAITGSENLHDNKRNWMCFNVQFDENSNPKSGDIVKLGLSNPKMEFFDYYWTNADYIECFNESNLELLEVLQPLGTKEEPYQWQDELKYPPFTVFISKIPE